MLRLVGVGNPPTSRMSLPRGPHRWTRRSTRVAPGALIGSLLALALAAPPASAATASDGAPELSERLRLLSTRAVQAQAPDRQARILGLPADGAASLVRDGERVVARVRVAGNAADAQPALEASGAEVLHVSARYGTLAVAVAPADLTRVAAVPGVLSVSEALAPQTNRLAAASDPPPPRAERPATLRTVGCRGSRTSAGDVQLGAAQARTTYGVNGSGVTVGILSDSFAWTTSAPTLATDILTGDLPGPGNPCGFVTPTDVRAEFVADASNPNLPGTDEGRAMAQIVHDLAPGAQLSFATAMWTMEAFADSIRLLARAGAGVLVDDVSYLDEPFFQDGPVSEAVSEVTAAGSSYVTAAGNNNTVVGGRDVGSWETPAFRPTTCPPPLRNGLDLALDQRCEDFDPGPGVDPQFQITIAPRRALTIDLQWAQPWNGVTTDIDAYILNAAGTAVLASSREDSLRTQRPVEVVGYANDSPAPVTVNVAIARYVKTKFPLPGLEHGDRLTPRLKFVMANNDPLAVTATEYPASQGGDTVGPTIFGHNGAASAISVAAINVRTRTTPEIYSSRGPVGLHFGPASRPNAPAAPVSLAKPDVTASDCGDSTRFGGVFCGTSAAAPHAAAVVALARQLQPTAGPTAIADALRETAAPIGDAPPTVTGRGLIDAGAALARFWVPGGDPSPPGDPGPPADPTPPTDATPDPPTSPAPDPKLSLKPTVVRTTCTLRGPRAPKRHRKVVYRVTVRGHPRKGRARPLAGVRVRVTVDRQKPLTVRTDHAGTARFRVAFSRGRHRLLIAPLRQRGMPSAPRISRTIRVR